VLLTRVLPPSRSDHLQSLYGDCAILQEYRGSKVCRAVRDATSSGVGQPDDVETPGRIISITPPEQLPHLGTDRSPLMRYGDFGVVTASSRDTARAGPGLSTGRQSEHSSIRLRRKPSRPGPAPSFIPLVVSAVSFRQLQLPCRPLYEGYFKRRVLDRSVVCHAIGHLRGAKRHDA